MGGMEGSGQTAIASGVGVSGVVLFRFDIAASEGAIDGLCAEGDRDCDTEKGIGRWKRLGRR